MGSEPMADQVPTMSEGFPEPGLDHAGAASPASEGAACAANAHLRCEEANRVAIDDDVTAVVPRGFPRLFFAHNSAFHCAATMFGIAAIGFVAMGIAKVVKVRARASSDVAVVRAPTTPARVSGKPGARTPTGGALSAAKLDGDTPVIAAVPPPPGRDKTDLAICQDALAKRQTAAIARNCEHALDLDPSLAAPILGWTMRELDRGNVSLAAAWARRVLDANDHLANAYLVVGVAEQAARHASAAKTAYRRYLELAPKGRYARDVRSSMAAL